MLGSYSSIAGYRLLPDLTCRTDLPTIQVSFDGRDISRDHSRPGSGHAVEKQFSTIAGIDLMTSRTPRGIPASRSYSTSAGIIDAAAQDVQSATVRSASCQRSNYTSQGGKVIHFW